MWKYCEICYVIITIYIYMKGKQIQTEDLKKKKKNCWCLWAGSLAEADWEGLLLVKVGVTRKVRVESVDMDWRVDTWDKKRCACEWGLESQEGEVGTHHYYTCYCFCIVEDLSLCLCFVRGNTANFFNPFFL